MQFTHVINPFNAPAGSEHELAMRVTYSSLVNACAHAREQNLGVEILAIGFPDDAPAVHPPARALPPLTRSILDFGRFKTRRRFPLFKDILQAACDHGTGEYLIYTNIDIALQRNFYSELHKLIEKSAHPFAAAINRRTISKKYSGPEQLEEMYRDSGKPHPGYDCFVFPRLWVPELCLGNTCIATRHFDGLLIANLDVLSDHRFQIFRDLCLTFHLGDDQAWMVRPDYDEFNMRETITQLQILKTRCPNPRGDFDFLYRGYMREKTPWSRFKRRVKRSWVKKALVACGLRGAARPADSGA